MGLETSTQARLFEAATMRRKRMPLQLQTHNRQLQAYENWDWDYCTALDWMNSAKQRCLAHNEMSVAVGSHSRNVVTLGRHATDSEITDPTQLLSRQIEVVQVDRGGGATIHGPGQVVLYPVIALSAFNLSIKSATELLEESMISCLSHFAISSHRLVGQPGIFINNEKIGSIGFRISDGIMTHGVALNVNNDLSCFSHIATCRQVNAAITSMATFVGETLDVRLVGRRLMKTVVNDLESI